MLLILNFNRCASEAQSRDINDDNVKEVTALKMKGKMQLQLGRFILKSATGCMFHLITFTD